MIMGDPPSSHLVVPWSRLVKRVAANTAESFYHFVDFALYGFLPLLSCCFVCLFICLILTRLTITVFVCLFFKKILSWPDSPLLSCCFPNPPQLSSWSFTFSGVAKPYLEKVNPYQIKPCKSNLTEVNPCKSKFLQINPERLKTLTSTWCFVLRGVAVYHGPLLLWRELLLEPAEGDSSLIWLLAKGTSYSWLPSCQLLVTSLFVPLKATSLMHQDWLSLVLSEYWSFSSDTFYSQCSHFLSQFSP